MAWEREHHHMDVAQGEHFISLVNHAVKESDGSSARHFLQIRMGVGPFEYHVGLNVIHIKLGGDFAVQPDGTLEDIEGNVFDPKAFEKELIARLNQHHEHLHAYARRHNVPPVKK